MWEERKAMWLGINNGKKIEESSNTYKLNNTFLSVLWVKEESSREVKNTSN